MSIDLVIAPKLEFVSPKTKRVMVLQIQFLQTAFLENKFETTLANLRKLNKT